MFLKISYDYIIIKNDGPNDGFRDREVNPEVKVDNELKATMEFEEDLETGSSYTSDSSS